MPPSYTTSQGRIAVGDEVTYAQLGTKVDQLEAGIKNLEKKMTSQGRAVNRLERKVFNGFGERMDAMNTQISSLETKIGEHKLDNETAHVEIKKVLGGMIKFGATALILIFIALLSILGSIWFRGQDTPREAIHPEVRTSASDDSNIAAE